MALETFNKTIGSHEYQTTQLGALEGRKVIARMQAAAAKAQATGEVSEDLSEFLYETFSKRSSVNIGGKWPPLKDIFDLHFAGPSGYKEMGEWLDWCVEVNFGGFGDTSVVKSP